MTIDKGGDGFKMSSLFITGTDTNVGKTITTALIVHLLREHKLSIIPYKPIQTGAILTDNQWISPDVDVYQTTNQLDDSTNYCTYLFKRACSPHLAAEFENIDILFSKVEKTIENFLTKHDGIVIEGAGGLYVPITKTGICLIDWIEKLSLPTIVVSKAGVGTINHTVLTIKALQARNVPILGIIMNNTENDDLDIILDNQKMIEKLCDIPVIGTIPFYKDIADLLTDPALIKQTYSHWNENIILEAMNHESTNIIR